MKKIIYSIALTVFSITINAQVRTNLNVNNSAINSQTAFFDASSSPTWNATTNQGKGMVFPKTNLTTLSQLIATPNGLNTAYPNRLDGMIVYNTGVGAPAIGATQTPQVTEGFYYYKNTSGNLNGGYWVRIGDGSANAKLALVQETGTTQSPAVATNLSIDNKDVFAVKGTFTNDGGNTVNIKKPEGFKTLHSIKMYRISGNTGAKQLAGSSLYSYEDVTEGSETKLKLIFGSGIISISYPEGEYEYVLEYLK